MKTERQLRIDEFAKAVGYRPSTIRKKVLKREIAFYKVGRIIAIPESEVARLLGDAPRSVEYWVRRFQQQGLAGLREGERPGRPRRLSEQQLQEIDTVLHGMPREVGLRGSLWDGKTLAAWIERQYDVKLGVRQCQRIFRQLGYRLRKPRTALAQADPERQQAHKKNSKR